MPHRAPNEGAVLDRPVPARPGRHQAVGRQSPAFAFPRDDISRDTLAGGVAIAMHRSDEDIAMQVHDGTTEQRSTVPVAEAPVKEWRKPVLTVMPANGAEFLLSVGHDGSSFSS
jgi:hypothetical protein